MRFDTMYKMSRCHIYATFRTFFILHKATLVPIHLMQPDIAIFALPTRHSFAEELLIKTGTLPVEQRVHDPPCSRLFPNPGYPMLYVI